MPKPLIKISGKALEVGRYLRINEAFLMGEEQEYMAIVAADLERTAFFDKTRTYADCERIVINNAGLDYAQGKLTGATVADLPGSAWRANLATYDGFIFKRLMPNQTEFEKPNIHIALDEKGNLIYKLLGKDNKLHKGTIQFSQPIQSIADLNLYKLAPYIRQMLVNRNQLDEKQETAAAIAFDLLFFNDKGTLSGLSLNYYLDYPDHWFISIVKEATAPFSEQNFVCFGHPGILEPMEYDEQNNYCDDFEVPVENITGDNLFVTLSKELNATDLAALLKPIFTNTGSIHVENLRILRSQIVSKHNIGYDKPNKELLIKKLQEDVQALYELPPIPLRDQLIVDITDYLTYYNVDDEWAFNLQQESLQALPEESRSTYTNYNGFCTLAQLENDYNEFQNRKNRLIVVAKDFKELNNTLLFKKFLETKSSDFKEYYLKKIAERLENRTLVLDERYPYYYDILKWMYHQKAHRDFACAQYSDQQVRTLEFLEFLDVKHPLSKLLYNSCLEGKVEEASKLVLTSPEQYGFTKELAREFYIRGLSTPKLLRYTHNASEDDSRKSFIREIAGRLIRQARTMTDMEYYLYNSVPKDQGIISKRVFGVRNAIALLEPIQEEVQDFLKKQCIKLEETAKGILELPQEFCQNRQSWQDNDIAMSPLIEDPYEKMETYRNALRAVLSDPHLTNLESEALNPSAVFCSTVVTLLCLICPLVLIGSLIAAIVCYRKTGSFDFLNTPDSQEVSYKLHKIGHNKLGLFLPVPEKPKLDDDNAVDHEAQTGSSVEHAVTI